MSESVTRRTRRRRRGAPTARRRTGAPPGPRRAPVARRIPRRDRRATHFFRTAAGRPRLVRVDPEPGVGRGLADRVDQLAVSVGPELDLEDRVAGIDRGLGLLTDALRLVESDRVGGRGRGRGVEPPETVEGGRRAFAAASWTAIERRRGRRVAVDDGRQFGLDLVERGVVADARRRRADPGARPRRCPRSRRSEPREPRRRRRSFRPRPRSSRSRSRRPSGCP